MAKAINKTRNKVTWKDVLWSETKVYYMFEKIMGQTITPDFPCSKLEQFVKLIKEDPNYKVE